MRDEAERSTKQLMLFQSPAQLSVNTECSISEGFHGYTGFPPTPSEHIHKISPGSRTISSANTATQCCVSQSTYLCCWFCFTHVCRLAMQTTFCIINTIFAAYALDDFANTHCYKHSIRNHFHVQYLCKSHVIQPFTPSVFIAVFILFVVCQILR